jgi:Fuc2NAc and GlcNAc transferase
MDVFLFLPLLLGIGGAFVVVKIGSNLGLDDIPSHRSSHTLSIPKGGGIGILATFFFACLYLNLRWTFWLPGLLISLISFWGDKRELTPKLRLACQFLLAGIVLWNVDLKKFIPIIPISDVSIISTILYLSAFLFLLIFIVGTANIYNFMDGINGMAGITGNIAFFLLGFVSLSNEFPPAYTLLAFSISLATLGFLPFNFPKATVFMGDVGSVLLGFVFASFVLLVSNNWNDFLSYCGFIFPFYIDEVTTMIERIRKKESLTQAHRQHFYQLLVNEKKIPHWKVSLGYGISQIIISCLLIELRSFHIIYTLILYFILSVMAYVGFYFFRKHHVRF